MARELRANIGRRTWCGMPDKPGYFALPGVVRDNNLDTQMGYSVRLISLEQLEAIAKRQKDRLEILEVEFASSGWRPTA